MARTAKNPVSGLTKKQDEFCFQCIKLGDPNRAYRVAYDNWTASQPTVRVEAWKLLRVAAIEERLHELQQVADQKLNVSIERIAKELACIGFSRITDVYDDKGDPIPFHLLPDDVARAVHSVTIVEREMLYPVAVKLDAQGNRLGEATPEEVLALAGGDKRKATRVKKALKKQTQSAAAQSIGVEFVPIREKKLTMHDKQPALQTMARWKKMISDRAEAELPPNDPRGLTDEQLEAEIRANEEALSVIDKARKRQGGKKEAAGSKVA